MLIFITYIPKTEFQSNGTWVPNIPGLATDSIFFQSRNSVHDSVIAKIIGSISQQGLFVGLSDTAQVKPNSGLTPKLWRPN